MGVLVSGSEAQVTALMIICKMGAGVANEGVNLTRSRGDAEKDAENGREKVKG
jgi:hypothetical protein